MFTYAETGEQGGHNGSLFRHFDSAYSCVLHDDDDDDDDEDVDNDFYDYGSWMMMMMMMNNIIVVPNPYRTLFFSHNLVEKPKYLCYTLIS